MTKNNLDFLKDSYPKLYNEFLSAEAYCLEIPEHSLVKLRGFARAFSNILCKYFGIPAKNSLGATIYSSSFQNKVPEEISNKLEHLRLNGNKGAHPESFNLTHESCVQASLFSLKEAFELSIWLYKDVLQKEFEKEPSFVKPIFSHTDSIFRKAIVEGEQEAQHQVGFFLKNRAEKSLKEKRKLPRKENNDFGFLELINESRDFKDAFDWFSKSAYNFKNQHPDSLYNLGGAHLYGLGTEQDEEYGKELIERAALEGSGEAKGHMGFFYLKGENGFKKDPKKAFNYFRQAIEQDDSESLNCLVEMYRKGEGVQKDFKKAFEYAEKAAQAGYPAAQSNFAKMYMDGIGVKKNQKKAMYWYEEALKSDDPEAQVVFSKFYSKGNFVEKDEEKALKLLKASAEQYHPESLYLLGLVNKEGKQVKTNYLEAIGCFRVCLEHDKEEKFKEKIKKECSEIIPLLKKRLATQGLPQEEMTNTIFSLECFDKENLPVVNQQEKFEEMLKKSQEFNSVIKEIPELCDKEGKPYPSVYNRLEELFRGNPKGFENFLKTHPKIKPLIDPDFKIQKKKSPTKSQLTKKETKIGRNEPCPCGSGKKYKKCCGVNN